MAYTTIDDPSAYFQTTIYSGTGSEQVITHGGNSDLQADWVWIKRRDATNNHRLTDVVRGATKEIYSDLADAEDTQAQGLKSFASDGFTLGTNAGYNASSATYVSWNWKAGTSFTNDASSTSVGTIDSSGSTNQTAGFSIVSWTGTGSAGTVAHNLGSVPEWYIIKNRGDANNWAVYHQKSNASPEDYALYLDGNSAATDDSGLANDTAPTSTVFSLTDGNYGNQSSHTYIGYFFSEVQGYSKFGTYKGNGSTDGTFVYLGFKPAFVMWKRTDTTNNWMMGDNKQTPFNPQDNMMRADLANAQLSTNPVDFLSNGFKIRLSGNAFNNSSGTYIYMAFAESPLVSSTGVPATAR